MTGRYWSPTSNDRRQTGRRLVAIRNRLSGIQDYYFFYKNALKRNS